MTSPSDPVRLDLDHPVPATRALVALLGSAWLASGAWLYLHGRGAVEAWVYRDGPGRQQVGGQVAARIEDGEIWRLWTKVVLHADLLHLLLNSVALLSLGRLLEPTVGGWTLGCWFVLSGLVSSWGAHLAGLPASDGASGGAYGLLGALLVRGWLDRPRLDPEDRRLFGELLWLLTALNVVLSLILPFIDVLGHLYGLAVGLALALARPGGGPWLWDRSVVLVGVLGLGFGLGRVLAAG